MMNSYPTGIDNAVALLAAQAETGPLVEPVEADVLKWRETPPDAQLHRLTLGDVVLFVHARTGDWACTWSMGGGGGDENPMNFVGVVADALVFADGVPDWLWMLVRGDDPLSLDVGYKDGMCGAPAYMGNGVAHWGSFPYVIPDSCAKMVFEAAPQVSTLVMRAIDAAADGPRHVMITHRG